MIKCPNCSGEMQFDPVLQKVKCQYCGSVFSTEELSEDVKSVKENPEDYYEGKTYKCSQCGATLMNFDETAITFCSYCGSQAMLEDKMEKVNSPDFVIPFQKTKEECIQEYKKKVSRFLFAPDYMKSDMVVDKFRGIYMPYAIYDLKKEGNVGNKGSVYAYRRGDYVYYRDYMVNADVDVSYYGISHDLVSKFYDNYSTAIPFNTKEAVPFEPAYLTGYYADVSDVHENTYVDDANDIVMPDVTERFMARKEFRKYGCKNPKILFKSEKKKGMFPAYFLAMRDEENQNVSYAVVNGQTGKVAVDLPIDFKKYVFSSLALALVLFTLIQSFLVLTPGELSIFSLISSVIALAISHRQCKKIEVKSEHLDDSGMNYVLKRKTTKKVDTSGGLFSTVTLILLLCFGMVCFLPFIFLFLNMIIPNLYVTIAITLAVVITLFVLILEKSSVITHTKVARADYVKEKEYKNQRVKLLYKEVIAIIISIGILFLHFTMDFYYYIGAMISLFLVILSFRDLVKEHNLLVSHRLPQLEKRGGDENE